LDHSPGTTPALRLGPGAAEPGPALLLDEEPLPEVPSLLGAAGPVAGVAGVAVGRDMVLGSRYVLSLILSSETYQGSIVVCTLIDEVRNVSSLLVLQLSRYGMVY
jgi:hypothetical protein